MSNDVIMETISFLSYCMVDYYMIIKINSVLYFERRIKMLNKIINWADENREVVATALILSVFYLMGYKKGLKIGRIRK